MNKITAAIFGLGVVVVAFWWWNRPAFDQAAAWPQKPVRLILPAGSGGGLDLTARLIAEKLAQRWGQTVIIDNRPGGDGLIATAAFAKSRDDHTLFFGPTIAVTLFPQTHKQLPYDPDHDLVPISIASEPSIVIAATASFPATSLAELVELVRARPGEYVWTSVPSVPDMLFSAFLKLERLEMKRAAYSEISAGLQDFGQGRVQIMVSAMPTVATHLRAGRARLLAVATSTRAEAAPEIPTLAEAGYPSLTIDGSFGFYGWRGMSVELRHEIAAAVRIAVSEPTLAERLIAMGQTPRASSPEEFSAMHERQRHQFGSLLRLLEAPPN